MISGTLTNVQFALLAVNLTDKKGNKIKKLPAGASISFHSSDEAVLKPEPQPDGMSCKFTTEDVGTATIGWTATGLVNSAGDPITGEQGDVEVIDAPADSATSSLLISDE